jgi:hypothetical protein
LVHPHGFHLGSGVGGQLAALHVGQVDLEARLARIKGEFAGHGYGVPGFVGDLHFECGRKGLVVAKQFAHGAAQLWSARSAARRAGLRIRRKESQTNNGRSQNRKMIFHGW